MNWGHFLKKLFRANKTVLIFSSILIAIHFLPSFIARTIISTPLLTFGFYGFIGSFLFLVASLLIRKFSNPKPIGSKISCAVFLIILVTVSWVLFRDLSLRYGEQAVQYQSYTEKNGNLFYNSPYCFHNLWKLKYNFHPGTPNSHKIDRKSEFEYQYSYNNLGFRNDGKDIYAKSSDEYRILAIGDSWTEGVGTPDGQTWTAKLQSKLDQYHDHTEIINVGKAGSDPIFQLYTLQNVFDELQPDEILLTINKSDINDIIGRGGQARIKSNKRVSLRTGPWWEFFYAGSFLVRKYVREELHYSRLLIKNDDMETEFNLAESELFNSIKAISDFCKTNQIALSVITIADYWDMNEVMNDNLNIEWSIMIRLNDQLRLEGIRTVYLPDCYKVMINDDPWNYWWKYDYHHTPKGYSLMADCIFDALYH